MTAEAITITGTVQHRSWQERVVPPVELVRPGLWSVPTVFPDNPLRYVLTYVFEIRGGVAIVDTGWPTQAGWDDLVAGLQQTGFDVPDVKAILITHAHADHYGLAERLRQESGAWIGMHELDSPSARSGAGGGRAQGTAAGDIEFVDQNRIWLAGRGMLSTEMPELPAGVLAPVPAPDVLIADGDRPLGDLVALQAVWTPGHTPGHLCFADLDRDLLLTGDHLLPRITPNISPGARTEGDTLGEYLQSLTKIGTLPYAEVLPAHEYRFSGLGIRTRQLLEHHALRLWEVVGILENAPGATTLRVAETLRWSRPWSQTQGVVRRSAIGEAYAHLMHLQALGLIINRGTDVDAWSVAPNANVATMTEGLRMARPAR
jgi:glyoxylase-like metal-dependent hydrolase (beta-lactamase superfamily II)